MRYSVVALSVLLFAAGCSSPAGETVPDLGVTADVPAEVRLDVVGDEQAGAPDVTPVEDLVPELSFDTTPKDTDPGLPACEPGEGCFLDPCTQNSQCQSGFCVQHMGEGVCTQLCQEECPPGWGCRQVGGAGPDLIYACVSEHANLCRPCTTSADCTGAGDTQAACLDYGTQGSFCGGPCGADGECPWGFACKEAFTVQGVPLQQCVNEAGVCPCTGSSVALGLATPCAVENEFGTCMGKRTCTADGLTACDAPIPAPEVCNDIDDDCDGTTDEGDVEQGLGICDDGNDCTQDSCDGVDGCTHEALTGTECLDGDPCTVADHCEEGVCAGDPVACDDDNPCTDDSCDGAGGCVFEPNMDDCDDGDPCTVADECADGVCVGVEIPCECQSDADCAALEDDDLCNGTLYCELDTWPYECAVAPETVVTCDEPPPGADAACLAATCDPATGACALVPVHEGMACDDGDQCSVGDTCVEGICAAGVALQCNDGNPCTEDSCAPDSGCVFAPHGGACNDGDVCTTQDQCVDGQCVGGPPLTCDDSNPCTDDACTPEAGCTHTPNQGDCDDGNACTTGDHCADGNCVFTGTPDCDDANVCTTDFCVPATGCSHKLNQSPCDDGDVCTTGDHCHLGACIASGALTCDDGNPCTDDQCKPASGCAYTSNAAPCDDGNPCTDGDQCAGGWCTAGAPLDCDDGNPCTDDSCTPKSGCQHVPNAVACDDGDACTTGDICAAGVCTGPDLLACDDGDTCTSDSCDPATGCVATPIAPCCGNGIVEPGEGCDDGNVVDGDGCSATCQSDGSLVPGNTALVVERNGFRVKCSKWQGDKCVRMWFAVPDSAFTHEADCGIDDKTSLRPVWHGSVAEQCKTLCWIATGDSTCVSAEAVGDQVALGGWMYLTSPWDCDGQGRQRSEFAVPTVGTQIWSFDEMDWQRSGHFSMYRCNW